MKVNNKIEREISFRAVDFENVFERAEIEFDSLTDAEWGRFYKMFLEGTHWFDVAVDAAQTIAAEREEF